MSIRFNCFIISKHKIDLIQYTFISCIITVNTTTMTHLIENGWIQYAGELPDDIYCGFDEHDHYGVLSFNTPTTDSNTHEMLYHIKVDVSGSMSDCLRDGRSKMQLIVHTLTNMLHYFAENTENVIIQISGFDDKIHSYIEPTKVTRANVLSLVAALSTMRPMNMTNIELALVTISENIEKKVVDVARNRQVVIFLTDGDSTVGENEPTKLAELVPGGVSAYFIALGDNHNSDIMYALGHKNPYTSNWFISQLEHTGNVYGEILFNEMHRVLEHVDIEVNNGKIFDYMTGTFVANLHIGHLSSEMKKYYHIVTDNPDECYVTIRGLDSRDGTHAEFYASDLPPLVLHEKDITTHVELDAHFIQKQFMRLGVQKLMSDLRLHTDTKLERHKCLISLECYDHVEMPDMDETIETRREFNRRARVIKKKINQYMDLHGIAQDELLCGLIDDLSVVAKTTADLRRNIRFATAREDSQGRQTTFNTVSDMQDEDELHIGRNLNPPALQRAPTSAYTSPGRLNVMRVISSDVDANESLSPAMIVTPTLSRPNDNALFMFTP